MTDEIEKTETPDAPKAPEVQHHEHPDAGEVEDPNKAVLMRDPEPGAVDEEKPKAVIPLHIRFGVLEAEFNSILNDTLATIKDGEANVLAATANEVAQIKAKFNHISQWAARRIPKK